MSRLFVSGLINLETTLAVDGFPLAYFPARYPFFGVQTTVSGVGYNIAKALTTLGNRVAFASLIGRDDNGSLVRRALKRDGIPDDLILEAIDETAQSVILYEPGGRRQIHTDLKDVQKHPYPRNEQTLAALQACDLAVICNVNFSRPLLEPAREMGKRIATDVHALEDLDDSYNQDYLRMADILFLSDESLPASPEEVAREVIARFDTQVVVIGLGAKGALLALREDGFVGRFEPAQTRPVVNSIGAGDALFSAFIDRYLRADDPLEALQAAMVFASYKIGEKGAASGFLSGEELDAWVEKTVLE